jgi:hypothetical protein
VRNIFDQYSQPENRMTHALMTIINEDRKLLGLFLHELVKVKAPTNPRKLSVLEQRLPLVGEPEPPEEELERRGIPDGWIFDGEGWCLFIESKVLSRLRAHQIRSHRRMAERLGFQSITAVGVAPRLPLSLPADTVLLEWRDVYAWLRRHAAASAWAARAADYLELAEAKLIDTEKFVEGSLTMFAGFPFGRNRPFTYLEGKRVLGLALGELRKRHDLRSRLGMNPKAPGRTPITGRQAAGVWDVLLLSESIEDFTKYPHLTLSVRSQDIAAMVTVPNADKSAMRANLKRLGEAGFQALTGEIIDNLGPLLRDHQGAKPWFNAVQRRFPSPKAPPHVDARIEFDLRTAGPPVGPAKTQPRCLSAAYGSFVNKGGSNYQMQMGVVFPYEQCPELRQADAIDLIAAAWLALQASRRFGAVKPGYSGAG